MDAIEEVLKGRANRTACFDVATLPHEPTRRLAVLACIDARLDLYRLLHIQPGEAHVLRNAGGIVTDDVIRSLTVSQRVLGTQEVMVIGHTGCGMEAIDTEAFEETLGPEAGMARPWSLGAFEDVTEEVRRSVARLREDRFLLHTDAIRGFVFDVDTGELREVVE